MSSPIAFLDGSWIPLSDARLSVADAGFVQGTTVAEQLRTFGGKLFRLEEHLDRLFHSLEIVDVDCGYTRDDLAQIAERIVRENYALEPPDRDLGLCLFVTPGLAAAEAYGDVGHPLVGMYTKRLAFHLWAKLFRAGERLANTPIRQVPQTCWPAELKCRSRMHYYLAD
ncbi:MAG: aminotransferase class IV, partial [Pirellulales bacterium]